MLTAIFAVYIGLGYVLLGIPRDAWRDILIYVEFFLTFAFYSAYWLFRKSDLQQYGRLDQWVRVSCYCPELEIPLHNLESFRKISSADAVHMKGRGSSLWVSR